MTIDLTLPDVDMTTEPCNSDVPDFGAGDPQQVPADVLRGLLNEPQPKSGDWQVAVGAAVGLLAVSFMKEPDDWAAFRSVALITLAQLFGNKDAKKRAIKLSRWAEVSPPPLTCLKSADERSAALNALAKLKAPWVHHYVQCCLVDPDLTDELIPDLLRWARSTFSEPLQFAEQWYASAIAACTMPERWLIVLKEAPRLLKVSAPRPASQVAASLSSVFTAALDSPAAKLADAKQLAGVVFSFGDLLKDQCALQPALLLQPMLPSIVVQATDLAERGNAKKPWLSALEHLSIATVSLIAEHVCNHGESAITHWQRLIPIWRSAYPMFDQHLEAIANNLPSVRHLLHGTTPGSWVDADPYAGESVFARLLPAFDAFVAKLPEPSSAASLYATLKEAAALVGVEPFGHSGELLDFDPLTHHLAEVATVPTKKVMVVRSGVLVKRSDGSTRVLVPALVTPT